jgi:hypothetical protein
MHTPGPPNWKRSPAGPGPATRRDVRRAHASVRVRSPGRRGRPGRRPPARGERRSLRLMTPGHLQDPTRTVSPGPGNMMPSGWQRPERLG